MSKVEKKVVAIVTSDEFNLARKIKTSLESDWSLEISQFKDFTDYRLSYLSGGLIVAILSKNNQLQPLIQLLNLVSNKGTKVIVISKILSTSMIAAFRKLGVSETYPMSIGVQKIIDRAKELIDELKDNQSQIIVETLPINVEQDIWLSEHTNQFKKINNFWVFHLIGPPPNLVEWKPCSIRGLESLWQLNYLVPDNLLLKNCHLPWLFAGKKPSYANGMWFFTSDSPSLFLHRPPSSDVFRVKSRDHGKVLEVAKNSIQSFSKIELLEKSNFEYQKSSSSSNPIEHITTHWKGIVSDNKLNELIDKYLKGSINNNFIQRLDQLSNQKLTSSKNEQKIDPSSPFKDFSSDQFKKIESKLEKVEYLSNLSKDSNNVIIWTANQELIAEASAYKISDDEYRIDFGSNVTGLKIIEKLQRKQIDKIFVRGNLENGSIFFKIDQPDFSITEIEAYLPDLMWRVQRRRSSRLKVDGRKKLMVNCRFSNENINQQIEMPIRDIGVGGMAFLISDHKEHEFKTGQIISLVSFIINKKRIQTPAIVRWKSKVKKQDRLMGFANAIGVEFLYFDEKDQEFINRYVLEELYNQSIGQVSKN
jgi:hypothetical protein